MIVAGIGFRKFANPAALREAFLAAGGLKATALATAEDKANAAAFMQFAAEIGLPVVVVPLALLSHQTTATQSERVAALYGTGSLAEASALAAAGPNARLIAPRIASQDGTATAALAERITP